MNKHEQRTRWLRIVIERDPGDYTGKHRKPDFRDGIYGIFQDFINAFWK